MATADYGVFGGFKGIGGARKEAEAAMLKKQLVEAQIMKQQQSAMGGVGSDAPAAIQIANEYAKARAAGDTQRMNDIALAAKIYDKGLSVDQNMAIGQIQGYAPAVAGIEGAKAGAKQNAENVSDAQYKPGIAKDVAIATSVGKDTGEKTSLYQSATSKLPQLNRVVSKLDSLADKATYSLGGKATDYLANQAGFETNSGTARAAYLKTVDNEVLPLLRDTFGAAFTVAEGDNLRATLGGDNLTPAQKKEALRAFIDNKYATLESMGRELGQTPNFPEVPNIGGEPAIDRMLQPIKPSSKLRQPPKEAIAELKANPQTREYFDATFGKGAARMYLGK